MRRCTRCVMPDTVPGITFNQDGVCSLCQTFREQQCLGEEALERVIASAKKQDGDYDCIVPVSGGRDSTYVLYLAKARFGLKVLAVNYDNEFRTDQALVNMEKACEVLDVDFVSVRSKRGIGRKAVRAGIRFDAKRGLPPFSFCSACTYGFRSLAYRSAIEHKVPLILWGESQHEYTGDMVPKLLDGLNPKRSIVQKLSDIDNYRFEFDLLLQRLEFPVPGNSIWHRGSPVLKDESIKEIKIFDYIPWDRRRMKEVITTELMWEKLADRTSTWRIDCLLHSCVTYSFYKLFGCSKDCFGYTNMINDGQMDREQALKQEEEMTANVAEGMQELLEDTIGLSKEEATEILAFQSQWDDNG